MEFQATRADCALHTLLFTSYIRQISSISSIIYYTIRVCPLPAKHEKAPLRTTPQSNALRGPRQPPHKAMLCGDPGAAREAFVSARFVANAVGRELCTRRADAAPCSGASPFRITQSSAVGDSVSASPFGHPTFSTIPYPSGAARHLPLGEGGFFTCKAPLRIPHKTRITKKTPLPKGGCHRR